MKRIVTASAVTVLAVGLLSGCTSEETPTETTPAGADVRSEFSQELHDALPEDIKEAGVVSVAGETNQPWRVVDADGEVSGLGEDILAELSAVLGVEFKTELVTGLPAVKLGFQSGRNDIGAGPLLITETTKKDVTFIEYLQGRPGIVTPAAEPVEAMLDLCGATVAYLDGSNAWAAIFDTLDGRCVEAGEPNVERLPLADINAAILAVESGRADAAGVGAHQSAYTAQERPEKFSNYIATREEWTSDLLGMGFEVNNLELAEAVQAAWQEIFDNGVYADLMEQYGLTEIMVEKPVLHIGG